MTEDDCNAITWTQSNTINAKCHAYRRKYKIKQGEHTVQQNGTELIPLTEAECKSITHKINIMPSSRDTGSPSIWHDKQIKCVTKTSLGITYNREVYPYRGNYRVTKSYNCHPDRPSTCAEDQKWEVFSLDKKPITDCTIGETTDAHWYGGYCNNAIYLPVSDCENSDWVGPYYSERTYWRSE